MASVRPRFLLALAIVVVGAAAALALPKILHSIRLHDVRANLAAATKAEARLQVPADFIRLSSSNPQCLGDNYCYLVKKSTPTVVATIRGIFRSFGAAGVAPWSGQAKSCGATDRPGAYILCNYTGRVDNVLIDADVSSYIVSNGRHLRWTSYSLVEFDSPYPPKGFCSIPGLEPGGCG